MRRPRRLFRGSGLSARTSFRPGRSALVAAGITAACFGVAALFSGSSGALFGRMPPVTGVIVADPPAVAVVDGDTLRLHETVIRLHGVQAPRRGATCRGPDGSDYDCGRAAAAELGRLVRGRSVACRLAGRDRHGLPQGECDAGGTEVNRAIVAAGWARADEDGLADEERRAKAELRGVWRGLGDPSF